MILNYSQYMLHLYDWGRVDFHFNLFLRGLALSLLFTLFHIDLFFGIYHL